MPVNKRNESLFFFTEITKTSNRKMHCIESLPEKRNKSKESQFRVVIQQGWVNMKLTFLNLMKMPLKTTMETNLWFWIKWSRWWSGVDNTKTEKWLILLKYWVEVIERDDHRNFRHRARQQETTEKRKKRGVICSVYEEPKKKCRKAIFHFVIHVRKKFYTHCFQKSIPPSMPS